MEKLKSNEPQKIIVPYSKGNEEKKEPLPQKIHLSIGPVQVHLVALYISQLEEQGWTSQHVLFGGVVPVSQLALLSKDQQGGIPVYHIITWKIFNEGAELNQPILNIPKG